MSEPDPTDGVTLRAQARIGTLLREKWKLDELLGVGGMAAVYAATHRNGSRAAVKMLHLELSLDAEIRRRFLREGYVANSVGHVGAVRVIDDDVTADGSVFIVMDLLVGETLEQRSSRKGGRLSPEEVLVAADQLLDVLAAAHEKGVVHRDIKPDNVFITDAGALKLLDFGIARIRELQGGSFATMSGSTMGTPAYMSPEQALGRTEEVDGRTDVFSVGAMMFELLSGRCVHEARTLNEALVAAASRPAISLLQAAPAMPPEIAAVVDRALAFAKENRWPDARAMQRAIASALEELGWSAASARATLLKHRNQSVAPPSPSKPAAISVSKPVAASGTMSSFTTGAAPPRANRLALGIGAGIALAMGVGIAILILPTRHPNATATDASTTASTAAPITAPSDATVVVPASAQPIVEPTAAASATPSPTASAATEIASAAGPSHGPPTSVKPRPMPTHAPAKPGDDNWLDRQH